MGDIAVVKRCVLLVVICVGLFILGCRDTKFWCDHCRAWYHNNTPYYVTEKTVDVTLCEECYKQYLTQKTD